MTLIDTGNNRSSDVGRLRDRNGQDTSYPRAGRPSMPGGESMIGTSFSWIDRVCNRDRTRALLLRLN